MFYLVGGIFLGWSLGANDAANVFGSAVSSRMLKFWTAAALASVFVLVGALLEGKAGIETYTGLTQMTLRLAVISSVAAAVTVTLMTILRLNVTAFFVAAELLTVFSAVLIGGLSISLGIMTFSRGVMETVGKRLVKLDPFSAFVVVLAEAITIHFYTFVGVPVSTSQAVVGAVLGVGIVKGINTIRRQTLVNILLGWFLTPVVACFLALAINFAAHLRYVPSP